MQIHIRDRAHPEDIAMMQSLYSRSPDSVLEHEIKVEQAGSGKFMSKYYIGYGHRSIGDCGTTTIFLEGVSMLAAKAIQDWPLYNGQEASTRYMDFGGEAAKVCVQFQDKPGVLEEVLKIQNEWLALYDDLRAKIVPALKARFPLEEGKRKVVWERAIQARSFDICRSLLPIGSKTNLSWHTNLRQARDKIEYLVYHPLKEVSEIGHALWQKLKQHYPHSFDMYDVHPREAEVTDYRMQRVHHQWSLTDITLAVPTSPFTAIDADFTTNMDSVNIRQINKMISPELDARKRCMMLPRYFDMYGRYNFTCCMDFGSFRDIQRHRNGFCPIPDTAGDPWNFNPWYIEQFIELIPDFNNTYRQQIERLFWRIRSLPYEPEVQYAIPMGKQVPVLLSYSLPQAVYVAELRSGKTVHPTARKVAHNLARSLEQLHPTLKIHVDYDEDSFSLRRGTQTIQEK